MCREGERWLGIERDLHEQLATLERKLDRIGFLLLVLLGVAAAGLLLIGFVVATELTAVLVFVGLLCWGLRLITGELEALRARTKARRTNDASHE
jgi:hypothetical protein